MNARIKLTAAAVVALVGGITGLTTTAVSAEVPADASSGTIDTAFGTATWTRIVGDKATFPAGVQFLLPGPTGYLAFRGLFGCDDDEAGCPKLWSAEELVGPWEAVPLPDASSASLFVDGNTYWLTTGGPTGLWRSSDARDWREVDISDVSELGSPGTELFDWHTWLSALPVTANGTTIAPVFHAADDALSALGVTKAFKKASELHPTAKPTVFEVRDGWHEHVGRIKVTETPRGLRIRKRTGGAVLAELDGINRADFDRLVVLGAPLAQVAIIEDDRVAEIIDVPWSEEAYGRTSIVPTDDGFRAYVPNEDGSFTLWHSTDGRSWSTERVIELVPNGSPRQAICRDGAFYRSLSWQAGPAFSAFLPCPGWLQFYSDDGVEWTKAPREPRGTDGVSVLSSGTIAVHDVDRGQGKWWLRVDGRWREDPEIEEAMSIPAGCTEGDRSDVVLNVGDTMIMVRSLPNGGPCPRLFRVLEFGPNGPSSDD